MLDTTDITLESVTVIMRGENLIPVSLHSNKRILSSMLDVSRRIFKTNLASPTAQAVKKVLKAW